MPQHYVHACMWRHNEIGRDIINDVIMRRRHLNTGVTRSIITNHHKLHSRMTPDHGQRLLHGEHCRHHQRYQRRLERVGPFHTHKLHWMYGGIRHHHNMWALNFLWLFTAVKHRKILTLFDLPVMPTHQHSCMASPFQPVFHLPLSLSNFLNHIHLNLRQDSDMSQQWHTHTFDNSSAAQWTFLTQISGFNRTLSL